jgi:lipoate-protein ligase A
VSAAFAVEYRHGAPGDLAALGLPSPVGRLLRWCHPDRAAIVLGRAEVVAHLNLDEAQAAGLPVVRRPSGGAAILVRPGDLVWADVIIPAGDVLWDHDVGRAAWWVGEAWAQTLRSLGLVGVRVHRAAPVGSPWSDRLCFAGLAAGEVTVDGPKVVGISQRRTKEGALFQCGCLLRWDPGPLLAVLRPPVSGAPLGDVAVGLDRLAPGISGDEVELAFETRVGRSP